MHQDGIGGLFFPTFLFLNAENDAYPVTVKNSTQGNFMDYNEIMAETPVSKAVIGGEEVELAMLGEIYPDKMESIMNTLLLDFFNKYLQNEKAKIIDVANLSEDIFLQRK